MSDKQLMILLAGIFLASWGIEDAGNVQAQKRAYLLAKAMVTAANLLP